QPPGELRVSHCLEGRHLLMAGLHELRPVVGPTPRREQPVDPVTGIAENRLYFPLPQAVQQVVTNRRCRHHLSFEPAVRGPAGRCTAAFPTTIDLCEEVAVITVSLDAVSSLAVTL